jgi:hypothetical protein
MSRRKRKIRLGQRDREILSFLGERGMSWLEPIHQRFYADRSPDAARSTMRRLCGRPPKYRYVRPEPLDGKRVYYRLTRKGAKLLGYSVHVTLPMGTTALIRRYALQWFFEMDGHGKRWHCNPRDCPDLFPVHGHRLPRGHFYLEKGDDGNVLGFAIEDYGSDVRRISRRAVDHLQRFLEHGWFDDLIRAQRFGVTFLTATDDKATAIERQFGRDSQRRLTPLLRQLAGKKGASILCDCLVVPGLLELLPSESKLKEDR